MCQNNLFDTDFYRVDPNNPHSEIVLAEDHFAGYFLPAVQDEGRSVEADRITGWDHNYEIMTGKYTTSDHTFELIV